MKIGILGYRNLGKGVEQAIRYNKVKCPLCQDKNFIFLSEPDITSGRARLF